MQRARSEEEIFETEGSTNTVSVGIIVHERTSKTYELRYRCIDHSMHRAAYHFIKALGIPSLSTTKRKVHTSEQDEDDDGRESEMDEDEDEEEEEEDVDVSLEVDAAADDVEAMASTTVVDFEIGDVLGKLLAFANQVRMSSEGVRDYLDHACIVHQLNPMQLRLWVRTRWGSMSNCLESTLAIQKVCLCTTYAEEMLTRL